MPLTTTFEANRLLLEGSLALSEIEAAGVRVDRDYVQATIREVQDTIRALHADMQKDPVFARMRRRFGERTKLTSADQVAKLVFEELGYTPVVMTDGGGDADDPGEYRGRASASAKALEHVDIPFVKNYLLAQKYSKLVGTYLGNIMQEMVQHDDGHWYVHPSYNLNTVVTFRSSCVAKGTLVEVVRDVSRFPKGVPIEDVRVGDHVYCYDTHGKLRIRKVLWSGKTGTKKVLRIHWNARGKHGYLDVTPDHKIRMASGEFVRADSLVEGADFRTDGMSYRVPKRWASALGRNQDRLYETGNPNAVLDHRLVYSELVGPLGDRELVHHRNDNHLDNRPHNLQRMSGQAEHATHHAPTVLTDDVRGRGAAARVLAHREHGDRWPSGDAHGRWLATTKFGILRLLARHGGSPTAVRDSKEMDFGTIKAKMKLHAIDATVVRRRYDADGSYITRGRMTRAAAGLSMASKTLRVGYYVAEKLYAERGVNPGQGVGRGNARGGTANNHRITKIEVIADPVDVYDLTVDEHHNYIANEICVHNCNNPNYQNIYKRDPAFAAVMRKAYRSRPKHQLAEVDYSSAEVKVAANYTLDPTAMREAMDSKADPHREAACKLLHLRPEQVNKYVRNTVKAAWVFAQFYGDYYLSCARNIWFQLQSPNATVEGATVDGKPLHVLDHLKARGIKELGDCDPEQRPRPGTFEAHAQQVEDWYWNVKYPVHSQWKRDWYNEYLRRGGFVMKTGFAVNGVYKRNEVINSPIQGSSFHCLLKAMIRIVKLLKKYKFRSRVIGEVHDSLNLDVHPAERDDVIHLCRESMTTWLVKQWPWLVVPPQVEPECCPIDGSWYDLAALKEENGLWVPADRTKWAQKYGDWSLQC